MKELSFDYSVPPIGGSQDVAERHEIDPNASSIRVYFEITIAERQSVSVGGQAPAPVRGRIEYIAIMVGQRAGRKPKNQPKKLFGLTQGAEDQLIVTSSPTHTSLNNGQQRVLNSVRPGQIISGVVTWNKETSLVRFELSTGQKIEYTTQLDFSTGGRVVLGVDEGNTDRHAELFTWPPSGARIKGKITIDSENDKPSDGQTDSEEPVKPTDGDRLWLLKVSANGVVTIDREVTGIL